MRALPARGSWGLRAAAFLAAGAALLPAQVVVEGRVLDENGAAVAGARIEFRSPVLEETVASTSDVQGRFREELPLRGEYSIHAERTGYFVLERSAVVMEEGTNEITVTLNHLREFVESLDVVYSPPAIDPVETTEQKQLNSVEILEVPYPAAHDFRRALPLLPGVVKDITGQLHFNGGASDQTSFTLEGFNISDPVTGTLEARLNIDSVRSLELESSRFSVDQGRGSAGALGIKTGMGDDRWRFSATSFLPGIGTNRGVYIDKWSPRLTFSGPLHRGRAWFYNGFDTFYDVNVIEDLPRGEDRMRSSTTSNLTRVQVNLSPGNILTAGYLINYIDTDHHGLSVLDPLETTLQQRRNFHMVMVKDQIYLRRGMLMEFGFSASRSVARENPQGTDTFEISPFGRRGNYFVDLTRNTDRQQWTADVILPAWEAGGKHQWKFGLDMQRSGFRQSVGRHDYRILRTDGTLARHVSFTGGGELGKTNFETALYAQDRWSPREGLMFEIGARVDWDQIVRNPFLSPRFSVAWAPARLRDTRIAAGYGVFADAMSFGILTRHQDQLSAATFFSRDGLVTRGPIRTGFLVDEHSLRVPRARLLSLSVDRKLSLGFYGKAAYVRRAGVKGFTFVDPEAVQERSTVLYLLRNQRGDRYDAIELGVRRTFAAQFEWFASYLYSRARSNAVIDYSLENPIFAPQAPGPVDWDTPHRFLSWGWAPVPARIVPRPALFLFRDTSVSFLVETRSGFPFSVVNEEGFLVGRPNQVRLPGYFSVNLHLERKFRFLHYQWAWRFGFNNLTNHGNPNIVNNNIDSPLFLSYGRGQPRAFNARLRFLGRR